MRKNLPVTGCCIELPEGTHLISTTDSQSCITYVNPNFVQITGFTTQELIGQPHNIIRHPDMPEAVFAHMWRTLKSGYAWIGVIKNRCKNGDHFWANTYATPIYQNGKITEYQAILTPVQSQHIDTAEKIYSCIRQHGVPKKSGSVFGVKTKLALWSLLIWCLCIGLIYVNNNSEVLIGGMGGLLWIALMYWQLSPIEHLAKQAQQIANNPLSQQVYSGRQDELGQIDLALRMAQVDTKVLMEPMAEEVMASQDPEELLRAIAYFRGLRATSSVRKRHVEY